MLTRLFLLFILLSSFIFSPISMVKAENGAESDNIFVFRRGNGGGNVTIKQGEATVLSCGNTCVAEINESALFNLSAEANNNSIFQGWSLNQDNTNINPQVTELNTSMYLSATTTNLVYAKFTLRSLPDNPVVSPEDRNVPRVMFWFGKVNQHWDLTNGTWATDDDGFSGARENKLEYCKKFYPDTVKVVDYKQETTNTWKDAGNVGSYISTKPSFRCVLAGESISGEDVSNKVTKPNSGSVCYHFPEAPLCLPLSDPRAVRSALTLKIDNFIANGADSNTEKLGSGERTAVLKSYELAFNKLPDTEEAFKDVLNISNGLWPVHVNKDAEKIAIDEFLKIYKRIPDFNNKNDEAAITVMAYGLRQKAENRNLSSEAAALKTFKDIYRKMPSSTFDWNVLQAITYSGAIRELDSDGDLLPDRRELELGTDPYNKDTDGDGYLDGIEVLNGYDPLKNESE